MRKLNIKLDYGRIIWTMLCAIACALAAVWFMSSSNTRKDSSIAVGPGVVNSQPGLAGQDTTVPAVPTFVPLEASEIADKQILLSDAAEKTEKVAQLQNEYIAFTAQGFGSTKEEYEAYKAGILNFVDQLRAMSDIRWFVDIWYSWYEDYDADRIQWYGYVDLANPLENEIPVVWICRTDTNQILYYVTARYNIETGKFIGGRRMLTLTGARAAAYTDESTVEDRYAAQMFLEDVYDLMDHIGQLEEEGAFSEETDEIVEEGGVDDAG